MGKKRDREERDPDAMEDSSDEVRVPPPSGSAPLCLGARRVPLLCARAPTHCRTSTS